MRAGKHPIPFFFFFIASFLRAPYIVINGWSYLGYEANNRITYKSLYSSTYIPTYVYICRYIGIFYVCIRMDFIILLHGVLNFWQDKKAPFLPTLPNGLWPKPKREQDVSQGRQGRCGSRGYYQQLIYTISCPQIPAWLGYMYNIHSFASPNLLLPNNIRSHQKLANI